MSLQRRLSQEVYSLCYRIVEPKRSFYNALGKLPAGFREILVLHEAEGWTYPQLAAALGITREEVATKLSAARRSLRQELGDPRWTEE